MEILQKLVQCTYVFVKTGLNDRRNGVVAASLVDLKAFCSRVQVDGQFHRVTERIGTLELVVAL